MSTFICEKCGCIDNTTCGGNYYLVEFMKVSTDKFFKDNYYNTHHVCVECIPSEYEDGSKNSKAGKWHDRFPKEHWSVYGSKEDILAICNENKGKFINAFEYFTD